VAGRRGSTNKSWAGATRADESWRHRV